MLRNCQVSVASLGAVAVLALLRRQQLQARALGSRISKGLRLTIWVQSFGPRMYIGVRVFCSICVSGFGIWPLGFRVWGSVQGSGLRIVLFPRGRTSPYL